VRSGKDVFWWPDRKERRIFSCMGRKVNRCLRIPEVGRWLGEDR
jgi:hypothetical protein